MGDGEDPCVGARDGPGIRTKVQLVIICREGVEEDPGVGSKKGRAVGAKVGEVVGEFNGHNLGAFNSQQPPYLGPTVYDHL